MFNQDLDARIALERYHERVAAAAHARLIAVARGPRRPLVRRAARAIGRALLRLAAGLLRYGQDERAAALPVYHPSAQSIRLN